jgi:hypothetical protein
MARLLQPRGLEFSGQLPGQMVQLVRAPPLSADLQMLVNYNS